MHFTERGSQDKTKGAATDADGAPEYELPDLDQMVRGDRFFERSDDVSDSSTVSLKCENSGDQSQRFSLLEEYGRGALNIIIKFDDGVRSRRFSNAKFGEVSDEHITFHDYGFTGPLLDSYGRVSGSAGGSDDDSVFIRIIQSGQLAEIISFPSREGFRSDEGIFYPLTGGFYSLAGGFEVSPIRTCTEVEVAILRASIDPDNLPCCMVKSGSQIMNSVAYYKGKIARQFFDRFNFENDGTGFGITLNQKTVRVFSGKDCELPFNIRNVIIGPIDFMFSPIKHRHVHGSKVRPDKRPGISEGDPSFRDDAAKAPFGNEARQSETKREARK
jgi:hypothetical protein